MYKVKVSCQEILFLVKNKLVPLSASLSQLSEALGRTILVTLKAGKFVIYFVAARGHNSVSAREPVSFI